MQIYVTVRKIYQQYFHFIETFVDIVLFFYIFFFQIYSIFLLEEWAEILATRFPQLYTFSNKSKKVQALQYIQFPVEEGFHGLFPYLTFTLHYVSRLNLAVYYYELQLIMCNTYYAVVLISIFVLSI